MNEREEKEAQRRFKAALAEAETGAVEPTPEEARNGWTAESLGQYLAEQQAAQSLRIDPSSPFRKTARPRRANGKYNPHKWRRS